MRPFPALALALGLALTLATAPVALADHHDESAQPAAVAAADSPQASEAAGACPGKPDGTCCGACDKLAPNVAAAKAASGAGCPCKQAAAKAKAEAEAAAGR
jgi:hypothetical protein